MLNFKSHFLIEKRKILQNKAIYRIEIDIVNIVNQLTYSISCSVNISFNLIEINWITIEGMQIVTHWHS